MSADTEINYTDNKSEVINIAPLLTILTIVKWTTSYNKMVQFLIYSYNFLHNTRKTNFAIKLQLKCNVRVL